MTSTAPNRRPGPPPHIKAFIIAVVVAFLIPLTTIIASSLLDVTSTAINVIYVAGMVVVLMLLIRWYLLYRSYKAARTV